MSDSTIRGRFVWHELLTADTKAAGLFFSKAIGWKTQPWGDDSSYTLFVAGPKKSAMAGLMALPEEARKMGAPNHWLAYVGTPNVDETAKQAASLGATVLKKPEDIPTVGRFAVIQDPQGAVFGIYTPNQARAADGDPALGDFSWHELATTDWKGALSFYQKLFGWQETSAMDMGEMGTYQMYGLNGKPLGGMFNKSPQMPGPAMWVPYIKVADAKKVAATVKKLGAQIIHGPSEVPGGDLILQGIDPQGAMFAVHSSKPAAAAPVAARTTAKKPAKKAVKKAAPKKSAVKKKAAPAKKSAPKRKTAVKKASAKPSKKTPSKAGKKGKKRR